MDGAEAAQLTALEHLHELARRLLWSVAFLMCGAVVAYFFRLQIINFLQRPLHETLYYTSPMGSFQFIMQVCLVCGLLCALPILLYNVIRFIEPAFSKNFTRKMVLVLLGASMTLTFVGVAFGYFVTLPVALKFFSSVGTSELHPLISVNEYFSFILGYLATFAIVFQIPLILLFIDFIHPINPGGLRKKRTIVYVGAFAISLIMPSSPDPLSQVSLAIPIIVLYEISILLVSRQHRKRLGKSSEIHYSSSVETADQMSYEPIHDDMQFADQLSDDVAAPVEETHLPVPTVQPEATPPTAEAVPDHDAAATVGKHPLRYAEPAIVRPTQESSKVSRNIDGVMRPAYNTGSADPKRSVTRLYRPITIQNQQPTRLISDIL